MPRYFSNGLLGRTRRTRTRPPSLSKGSLSPGRTPRARRISWGTVICPLLVHRRQLMDQWRERLAAFPDLPIGTIGQVGGGKNKCAGMTDVGVIMGPQVTWGSRLGFGSP